MDEAGDGLSYIYELGDDLNPGIDVYDTYCIHQGLVDVRQMSIVKPQCEQSGKRSMETLIKDTLEQIILLAKVIKQVQEQSSSCRAQSTHTGCRTLCEGSREQFTTFICGLP